MTDSKDQYWQKEMDPELKRVAKDKGTEAPYTGKYLKEHADGTYRCAVCGNPIFDAKAKFESGTGWPSFYEPVSKDAVTYHEDREMGMSRVEVKCGKCDAHLGHVFDDAVDQPTGKRYCINSVCLDLEKKK